MTTGIIMSYKNKELCKVRTITTFLSLSPDKETWKDEIYNASNFCSNLSKKFHETGYIVQSVRIVTNPFGEYLNTQSYETAISDLTYLSNLLNSLFGYVWNSNTLCYWRSQNKA